MDVSFLDGALELLVRQMFYATVIFGVVALLVRRWVGRSPRLVYAFWGLVMLRLVLPVDLASPLGLATLLHDAWPAESPMHASAAAPPIEAPIPALSASKVPMASDAVAWDGLVLGLWLLAAFGFGWRSFVRRRPFVRLAHEATELDDEVAHILLERWRDRYGLRRPIRLVTDASGRAKVGPFTVGTLCPIVYIPPSIARRPQLLDATLGHELAHVRRFDDLRLLGQEWVRALWVLFPLVHIAAARMRHERERICDVLATGPGCLSRRRYLAALRTILNDGLVPARAVPGMASTSPGILPRRKRSMRFDSLLSEPGTATPIGGLVYFAVLLLLMPMAPMITSAPAAAAPSEPDNEEVRVVLQMPTMINPLPGEKVTSSFGLRKNPFEGGEKVQHTGIDLRADGNSEVLAPADGVVVMATEHWPEHEAWGTVLILEHAGGLQTFYAHLASIDVKEGEKVRQGQVVAVPGSTGKSTGPHLHFEIHRDGEPIDPSILIPEWR